MRHKILAVDDDADILELIKETLSREDMTVVTAKDGKTCLEKAEETKPDLILLDIGLPDISGYKVFRTLKHEKTLSHIPVIMLTGRKTPPNEIASILNEGASDYLAKPVIPEFLAARVKVVLRLIEYKGLPKEVIHKCGVYMNIEERVVKVKGKPIDLTKKEFDLLFTLLRKSGKVIIKKYLLGTIWGDEDKIYEHTLDNHVSSLRKKLGPACGDKIVSVKSVG